MPLFDNTGVDADLGMKRGLDMARRASSMYLVCWLCALCLYAGVVAAAGHTPAEYGAEANPTGEPLGGGSGYSRLVLAGDYSVETRAELLAALHQAKAGEVIYLLPQARIDLTGLVDIDIPAGITMAGNRGYMDSPGPLIYTTDLNAFPLFRVTGAGSRITGLRLQGPDPERPDSIAINILADKTEIDNCEIFDWSYAGVAMLRAEDVHVHHNYIHNVRRPGLGYPVVLNLSTALVEANIFDYYRHAIAATGRAGTGYEARYNLVLGHAISHAFDMHGGADFCPRENPPCTERELYMAGAYVNIHHNTFLIISYEAIRLRGVPAAYVDIHHNWFIHPDPSFAVRYRYYSGGNASVHLNVYGPDQHLMETTVEPSPFIFPEGSRTPVAFADEDAVEYGFASPEAESAQPLSGSVPIELLPVKFKNAYVKDFAVTGVEIQIDGSSVYTSRGWLSPGSLTWDTMQMADGVHELTLIIQSNLGFPLHQSIRLQVNNWWDTTDYLRAPQQSGWFGLLDFTRTSDASAGWTYATDRPEVFYDDPDRRVRVGATTEFLTWSAPRLQRFRVIVYSRTVPADEITLWISADQSQWRRVIPAVVIKGPNAEGWYRLELHGVVPPSGEANWFRFMLAGGTEAAALQLGEVQLQGLNEQKR